MYVCHNRDQLLRSFKTWNKTCTKFHQDKTLFDTTSPMLEARCILGISAQLRTQAHPQSSCHQFHYSPPASVLFQELHTASIDVVEHRLEVCGTTVVRVVDYGSAFGVVGSKQLHFRTNIALLRSEPIQIFHVAVIERQDDVEATEIFWANLPCVVVVWNAVLFQNVQSSMVGTFSGVKVDDTGAVYLPLILIFSLFHQVSQDRFGARRPADIAQANEEDLFAVRHLGFAPTEYWSESSPGHAAEIPNARRFSAQGRSFCFL